MGRSAIPHYALYGELPAEPDVGFAHVESVPSRAALHNWDVKPHRHDQLNHILLITDGGGTVTIDGAETVFGPLAAIIVPAGLVHGFRFNENTEGFVLTLADSFLTGMPASLRSLLDQPQIVPLERIDELSAAFAALDQEVRWGGVAVRAAVSAWVTLVLVGLLRLVQTAPPAETLASTDQLTLYRFRRLMEEYLSAGWNVGQYAAALGLTPSRLTLICRRAANCPPQQLIHTRLLLEAKRLLLYTNMTASEVGYSLGFSDPAYFSRFFMQRVGLSPRTYRLTQRQETSAVP